MGVHDRPSPGIYKRLVLVLYVRKTRCLAHKHFLCPYFSNDVFCSLSLSRCLIRGFFVRTRHRFIDFHEEPQTFFLVLEKVPGGELFDRIIAEGKFTEESARACMRSLLEALAYCHSQKIAHRDVKPENILFASLDAKDRTVKVS